MSDTTRSAIDERPGVTRPASGRAAPVGARRHAGTALTERELVTIARALADATRMKILRTVASCSSLCCGDIGREVPVRPATVSHHLRVLADAGLVDMRRDGQFIQVCAQHERLLQFRDALAALAAGEGRLPAAGARRPGSRRRS
jgi:ArsR family transcriptional regulator